MSGEIGGVVDAMGNQTEIRVTCVMVGSDVDG